MTDEIRYTSKVNLPHTELIIGRSGCGKTKYLITQLTSILQNNSGLEHIFIICPTISHNKAYKNWKLPPMLSKKVKYIGCHQDDVSTEITEIMRKCKTGPNVGTEDDVRHLIVLDDCAQGTNVKGRTSPLVSIAFGARHVGVGIIVITQQLTSISKPYRDNLTRVVTFYTQSKQGSTLMYDEFLGETSPDTRKELTNTLKTNRYSYMVIDLGFPHVHKVFYS